MNAEHLKNAGDAAAITIGWATVFKWLPAIAAALTIIWTALRIYDWIESRLKKRRLRDAR